MLCQTSNLQKVSGRKFSNFSALAPTTMSVNPSVQTLSQGGISDGSVVHTVLGQNGAALPKNRRLANKSYDSDTVLQTIASMKVEAMITSRANRIVQREYDRQFYRERHFTEFFFSTSLNSSCAGRLRRAA